MRAEKLCRITMQIGYRIYLVSAITALGGFLYGYDTGVISGVLTVPAFRQVLGFTPENAKDLSGSIVSSLQVGGILGAVTQAYINDGLGRKYSILVNTVIFSVGAVIQTIAPSFIWFVIGRFISGFSLCVIAVAVQVYNAEVSPPHIRGRIVGLQQFMVCTGIACSYWVNYFVDTSEALKGQSIQYTLPLGLQVVPPIILFGGLLFLPRSPRWLATKGDYLGARKALANVREVGEDHPSIDDELGEIADFLDSNPTSTWTEVFGTKNLQRLSVGVPLILFQQFAGQNIINYFAPALFQGLGLSKQGGDLFATGLVGILKMVVTIPALFAVDRAGRRPLMLLGTLTMAAAFYYIGIFNVISPPTGGSITAGGYIAILMVYVFMGGYAFSWGIMHYCLPAEIYPLNIRAKAQSIGAVTDWSFQAITLKLYPYVIDLPSGGVYFLSAGLLTLFLIWIFVFLPETKGLTLEEVDLAFQHPRWRPVESKAKASRVKKV